MVYCGKLSKACFHCRKRKLRCDLCKEGCSQCKRAKLICHGYRDTNQLRIRDQTYGVSQRPVARKTDLKIIPTVTISLKDRANAAFFSNYVFHGSKSYDFLGPYYNRPHISTTLSASIEAVSLAFFAHQQHATSAGREGRIIYSSALHHVNKAIRCPSTARKDTTLLATMMLDLYEKLSDTTPEFDSAWKSHVTGSLALVNLRGPQRTQDRHSFRMLVRLSTNLLISCVATDTDVPTGLVALRDFESKYLNIKDPKWLLTDLMVCYVGLREAVRNGKLTDHEIIANIIGLDTDFVNLAINSPSAWKSRRIWLRGPTERALCGYIDVFLDHHITQTWNVSRLIRILLHEMLLEYASSPAGVGFAYKEGYSLRLLAQKTIDDLVVEICASTPQYTYPELTVASASGTPSSDSSSSSLEIPTWFYTPEEKVRAYTLIFPLYVAGQSSATKEPSKYWIIRQLHFMASTMGIGNAEVVAKILEADVKMNPWKVYALLGSYAFAA